MTNYNDPWDSAGDPQLRGLEYWGQVQIDTFYAALIKGQGKVPFNPSSHSADQRVTAIEILITPLAEQNIQFEVKRSLIAESKSWASIVLPSIKTLNLSARELNGKWVHVVCKPTGRSYVNQAGENKDETTFEFVATFPDENACKVAYNTGAPKAVPAASAQPAQPANGNGSKEKETAAKFLKVIVENAVKGQTDLSIIQKTVSANLATMPLVNKHFTVDSPETMELIMVAMQAYQQPPF